MDWLNMNWLTGKKTYIATAALAIMGASLVWRGFDVIGLYCLLTAAGFIGLGDRANRHQAQVLAAIKGLGQLAADVKAGDKAAAAADGEGLVRAVAEVAAEDLPADPQGAR